MPCRSGVSKRSNCTSAVRPQRYSTTFLPLLPLWNQQLLRSQQLRELGLNISRSIVESYGGHLSVITSGSGATFQFTLPGEASALGRLAYRGPTSGGTPWRCERRMQIILS
jgi:light-regulated signal transduction histidine kinase (bacteriophytochrome)